MILTEPANHDASKQTQSSSANHIEGEKIQCDSASLSDLHVGQGERTNSDREKCDDNKRTTKSP